VDNVVHPRQKTYFVTKNKNHVFGTDFAVRESMTSDEATVRFDKVWEQHLKPAILGGSPVDAADVRLRVPEANRTHVNPTACHREFRLSGSLWIAQITDAGNDQLWIVPNKAYDTRSITATFKTQDQKDEFDRLADEHGFEPQEYARRILTAHLLVYRDDDDDGGELF
jgi:hypothetical protein